MLKQPHRTGSRPARRTYGQQISSPHRAGSIPGLCGSAEEDETMISRTEFEMKQKCSQGIQEALDQLRNKPVKSTLLERIQLIEEADDLLQGQRLQQPQSQQPQPQQPQPLPQPPQPLQLGKGLGHILSRASVPVKPYDLLLGRAPEKVPNEQEEAYLQQFLKKYPGKIRPAWLVDGGHITFAWELLLKHGLGGLIQKTEAERTRRLQRQDPHQKIDFLTGMILVYQAYQTYIIRYGEEAGKEGLTELAAICRKVASEPPETFYQAMQLILLVGHAYSVYAAVNSTLTYGRLDDLLLPYYLRDLEQGILTRLQAACIIDDFNCKNNLILGRGEHQMGGSSATDTGWFRNPTYDTPQYVILGGYSNTHDHVNNPLTELFVERILPRFENPFYIFRYTKDVREALWERVCDKLRLNASLMVYNDETQITAMKNAGIAAQDAVNYTIHGCNWPDIPGDYGVIASLGDVLPRRIMRALMREDGTPRQDFRSMDEIYDELARQYREDVKNTFAHYRERANARAEMLPEMLDCTSCFTNDVIENANHYRNCVKYPVIYNTSIRNIGTAADMMAALERLIFKDNTTTLPDLLRALHADFDGAGELLSQCLQAAKFGSDNTSADTHAARLMNLLLDIIDEESIGPGGTRDVHCFNITTTDMGHLREGANTMATPDGRRNQAPLSENLSPTAGMATEGITALVHSLARLPFQRIHCGAFNMKVRKDWVSGDAGLQRLKSVLSTYFQMGGMQVQLSATDTAELRDAQVNPDKHRDLMVRITGYSAAFVDMCKKAQDEIIRRDEMG